MRNEKRELNDIKFEFLPDRDSAEGIAGELVGAGLVHAKDQNAGLGQGKIMKDNASRWRGVDGGEFCSDQRPEST